MNQPINAVYSTFADDGKNMGIRGEYRGGRGERAPSFFALTLKNYKLC